MKYTEYHGFTFDTYIGIGIGYRNIQYQFEPNLGFENYFNKLKKSPLTLPFRLGFSFGYAF